MNKHTKRGLISMMCWILFLAALYGSYSYRHRALLTGLLDKETGGVISFVFFIGWALIWFSIGKYYSYDYTTKKEEFHIQHPSLDAKIATKAFKYEYTSKIAKILSKLFFISVFAYTAINIHDDITQENCIYIGILMAMSVLTYWYYKVNSNATVI
ncbi:MAG: hypothetical protein J1E57_03155 [Prevotella sp.]|nr:hypothetical protein [Prevotella sp.]